MRHMPCREGQRKKIIRELAKEVTNRIRKLPYGSRISIAEVVREIYAERGYEYFRLRYPSGEVDFLYTRNKGESYAISDFEQFDVLRIVQHKLAEHCYFDFGIPPGKRAGIPYNLPFTIMPPKSPPK